MSDRSGIEWCDATWNPVTGCTKVSPGCDHCYAETFAERFRGTPGHYYEHGFDVQLRPDKLDQPLRWRKPRRIFVNSMSDLFHDSVPDEYIAHVFAVMQSCAAHTFQVLTKRHGRMRSLLSGDGFWEAVTDFGHIVMAQRPSRQQLWPDHGQTHGFLPNVWLGVSAENQRWFDIRTSALRETTAAVRFVSAEPLLGYIDADLTGIDWVIVGGESGRSARPMHPLWARGLRDQCEAAGTAFLFKQRGEWTWNEPGQFRLPTRPYTDRVAVMHGAGMTAMTKDNDFNPFDRGHPYWETRIERVGKKLAGRELDGRTWDQYPQAVAHA